MTSAEMDPKLDLKLERVIDVPPELVWQAWTQPEELKKWFTPRPWRTSECEIDLRPGGTFRVVMRSPQGDDVPMHPGCYLEIVPNERLVWTGALLPGFRPAVHAPDGMVFTCVVTLEKVPVGTRYTALLLHRDEAGRKAHEEMGFQAGWGAALDQLVELVKKT